MKAKTAKQPQAATAQKGCSYIPLALPNERMIRANDGQNYYEGEIQDVLNGLWKNSDSFSLSDVVHCVGFRNHEIPYAEVAAQFKEFTDRLLAEGKIIQSVLFDNQFVKAPLA